MLAIVAVAYAALDIPAPRFSMPQKTHLWSACIRWSPPATSCAPPAFEDPRRSSSRPSASRSSAWPPSFFCLPTLLSDPRRRATKPSPSPATAVSASGRGRHMALVTKAFRTPTTVWLHVCVAPGALGGWPASAVLFVGLQPCDDRRRPGMVVTSGRVGIAILFDGRRPRSRFSPMRFLPSAPYLSGGVPGLRRR